MNRTGLPRMLAVDLRAVSIAEGVRAALSVAVIVALNEWLRYPPIVEAALAALLTCLCDPGWPMRRRLPHLLAFAIFGALSTAGFGLLANAPVAVVVPVATFAVFCASFARVFGQPAMQVGNLLTVAVVLAVREPLPDIDTAALLGGLFAAGSLWAVLLTMVLWRIHPYGPARRAVADCFVALAALTRDLRGLVIHPSPGEEMWELHARAHRRFARDSIERARAAVLATAKVRGPMHARAARAWLRLEAAEQLFGALIALSELLEAEPDAATRRVADIMLRRITPVLTLLAQFIVTDAPDRLPRLERAVTLVSRVAGTLPDTPLHHIADAIVERLRIVVTLAGTETSVEAPMGGLPEPALARVTGPIRANLNRNSDVLRHAARVAAVALPAFWVTLTWRGTYEHWLTITTLLTMQPYFALTFTWALERIGGTVLGGIVASGIALVCTTPVELAAALFPLAVVALAVRGVSFGLFIACITPLVVLLSELGRPGESELTIAGMRALYTLMGGALAVAGSFALWPMWEPGRLAAGVRAAIAAHAAYAAAEISALLGEAPPEAVEPARRAAGMACNNVEASLQRALLEPRGSGAGIAAALTIDAALRRMAGRLSALQLDAHHGDHDRAVWGAWRGWIGAAMGELAEGRSAMPPRPVLPRNDPQADALARISRQVELAAGAIGRVG